MAFCGNCGTEINDGAKFCPKCGNPIGSTHKNSSNDNSNNFIEEEKNSKEVRTSRKWLQYGVFIIAFFACLYIFGMLDNNNSSTEIPTTSSQTSVQDGKSKMAKSGYDEGYKNGFDNADSYHDGDTQEAKNIGKTIYGLIYDAPTNAEEKELYNIFIDNFVKGYLEGYRNGK